MPSTKNLSPKQLSALTAILLALPISAGIYFLRGDWIIGAASLLIIFSGSYGLIQFTMFAPRRFSPVLQEILVRTVAHSKRLYDDRSVANFLSFRVFGKPHYSNEMVMEVTGPTIFTDTVLDVLSDTLPPTHALVATSVEADHGVGELSIVPSNGVGADMEAQTQTRVTWAPIHKLKAPLWIDASEAAPGKELGGLGVLPISVWGNGQRHSGSEGFDSAHACVNHRFRGSWKIGWKEYLFG